MQEEVSNDLIFKYTLPEDATYPLEVKVPITGTGNDYIIDWGESTSSTNVQQLTTTYPTHEYAAAGTYTIKISGTVNQFGYYDWKTSGANWTNAADFRNYLTEVTQLGETNTTRYGFAQCTKLASFTANATTNTFANVRDMSYMFYNCNNNNLTTIDVGNWNTSNVTSMSYMFNNCSGLTTLNVSNWNTGKVTDMHSMFQNCSGLTTLDVSNFATSKVTNMSYMFYNCTGLTSLNVSGFEPAIATTATDVTLSYMFAGCEALTALNLTNFNTSKVTNMQYMFQNCSGLNELDVSSFVTSAVTTMSHMFYHCSGLSELDVSNFVTSSVTKMDDMFSGCRGLSELDVSNFVTSGVTNMSSMFNGCSGLSELDVSNFVTSGVTNMSYMFYNCTGLSELDVSNFVTNGVTNMGSMFYGCSGLSKLDVSKFVTSGVTEMYGMFYNCSGLTKLDLSNFSTAAVPGMTYMFYGCTNLTDIVLGSNFTMLNGQMMFSGANSLERVISMYDDVMELPTSGSGITGYLSLRTGAVLYVPTSAIEAAYEDDENFSNAFGTAATNVNKVEPMLALAGDNPVTVAKGSTYSDAGATVAKLALNTGTDITPTFFSGAPFNYTLTLDTTHLSTANAVTNGDDPTNYVQYKLADSNGTVFATATRAVDVEVLSQNLMEREGLTYAIGAERAYEETNDADYQNYTVESIATITIVNSNVVPGDAVKSWDASQYKDGSVMAWVKVNAEDNTKYDLYIGQETAVVAPVNSENLFRGYTNCTKIDGLKYLDTSDVENMYNMFSYNRSIKSLDLRTLDTRNATNTGRLFLYDIAMETLILGENFASLEGSASFMNCNPASIIIDKAASTASDVIPTRATGTTLNGKPGTTLYVLDQTTLDFYLNDANYANIFGDRIKLLLEVVGDNPVSVTVDATYDATVDAGAKVAGFSTKTDSSSSVFTELGYYVETTGLPVSTSEPGSGTVTYNLYDLNDNLVSTLNRTVNVSYKNYDDINVDKTAPTITNIDVDVDGEILTDTTITITATITDPLGENEAEASGVDNTSIRYMLTTTSNEPETDDENWSTSNEFAPPAYGTLYAWIMASDMVGNTTIASEEFTFGMPENYEVNGVKYDTLANAYAAITTETKTTIKVLQDVVEKTGMTVDSNRDVVLDLNGHTITKTEVGLGVSEGGTLTIEGTGGITTGISSYLINTSGNLVVKSGSLSSYGANAIYGTASSEITIGDKDGSVSPASPVILGKYYAIESASGFNFYDGLLKGLTKGFYGEESDVVNDTESGYIVAYDEDGEGYKTAYLDYGAPSAPTITVVDAEENTISSGEWATSTLTVTLSGSTIGDSTDNVGYKYSLDGKTTWITGNSFTIDTDTNELTIYAMAYNVNAESLTAESSFVIKLDKTAPSKPAWTAHFVSDDSAYTSGTWTNQQVYTEVTVTEAGSGLVKIEYSYDGTTWNEPQATNVKQAITKTEGTNTYTYQNYWVLRNRNHTAYLRATDAAGNVSVLSEPFNVRYDLTDPVVTEVTATGVTARTEDITVTATDTYSGVEYYALTKTNAAPETGWQTSNVFTVTENATWYAWAKDQAGNVSALTDDSTITNSHVDREPVTFSASIAIEDKEGIYAKSGDVIVLTLTADKAVGIAPTVTIAGMTATVTKVSDTVYEARVTVTDTTTEGNVAFEVSGYEDTIGNSGTVVTSTSDDTAIYVDRTAPTTEKPEASAVSENKVVATNKQTDTAGDYNSGVAKVEYRIRVAETGTWSDWQESNEFTGLTLDTDYEVMTRTTDNAGNVSESVVSDVAHTKKISSGDITFTYSPNNTWTASDVTVTIVWPETTLTKYYKILGESTWTQGEGPVVLENYGDSVVARLYDGVNEVTNTFTVTNIDKTKPTVSATVSTDWTNTDKTINVTASDPTPGSGVAGYFITNNSEKVPIASEFASNTDTTTTFEKGLGTYYIWVVDGVGNICESPAVVTVTNIDKIKPVISLVDATPAIVNEDGSVVITFTATDAHNITNGLTGSDIEVYVGGEKVEPSSVDLVVEDDGTGEVTYTLTIRGLEGDGELEIVVPVDKAVDIAGNGNERTTLTTGVTVDNTAPELRSVTINNGDETTDGVGVRLTIDASDADYMYISESLSTPTDESEWIPYASETLFELSQGDGEKTVYVWVKDEAGNMVGPKSDSIELKTTITGNKEDKTTSTTGVTSTTRVGMDSFLITFRVTDIHFYSASITTANLVLYVDGEAETGVTFSNLSSNEVTNGREYTVTASGTSKDGVLAIGLRGASVLDRAGNELATTVEPTITEIVVDNTAPTLSVSGNTITVSDENLVGVTVNGKLVLWANGNTTYTFEEGETYTVVALDKAGNRSVVELVK